MEDLQGACSGATSAALYTCLGLRLRLRRGMLSIDMQDSVGEPSPSLSACTIPANNHTCACISDVHEHTCSIMHAGH